MLKNLIFAVFSCLIFALPARAEIEINVTGGVRNPMPIAIPEMNHSGFFVGRYADKVHDVISADLERSGLFRILPQNSYIQKLKSVDDSPNFTDWQAINTHALLQSEIKEVDKDNLKVDFRLWDIVSRQQLLGQSFTTTKDNWRRIAHKIADVVYERLTGEKGYFDTRIVYIAESGPMTKRIKRLAIMDQDGENHRYLTNGRYMSLTPRFSPNMQKITYLSYVGQTNR